jgi:hypothetical protein
MMTALTSVLQGNSKMNNSKRPIHREIPTTVPRPHMTPLCRLLSPSLFTAYDYYNSTFHNPVPPRTRDPDCVHACKLLSPARAFEWIYVDGLRRRYGWNATYAE